MAEALAAAMPPDLALYANYTIRLTALDPASGAVVSGVKVSALAMLVVPLGDTVPPDLAVGPYLLVPGSGA
jgi:hypothetical protein